MNDELIIELKTNIFSQAEEYLLNIGEFAPFGAIIRDEIVKAVGYSPDNEDDIIDSQEAIHTLKQHFSIDLKENKIQAAAIAYDVAINVTNADGISEKRDAMCLEWTIDGENWSDEYFPYMIIDNQCVWR